MKEKELQEQNTLLQNIEIFRLQIQHSIESSTKSEKGQFFTPIDIAQFMASLFPETVQKNVRILDPGAGIGILSAAMVSKILKQNTLPKRISITAYENDTFLLPFIKQTFELCKKECNRHSVELDYEVIEKDFIEETCSKLISTSNDNLFRSDNNPDKYDIVITNPPYKKILSSTPSRKFLSSVGIETTNLYSAFVALSIRLMNSDGFLVAITPRSFCNGLYFKPFRKILFDVTTFKRIHVFNSRNKAFSEDEVLQENIIYLLQKNSSHSGNVIVSVSESPKDEAVSIIEIPHNSVIDKNDKNLVINIIEDEVSQQIIGVMNNLPTSLKGLGLDVSTGQVVDFRSTEYLSMEIKPDSVPLIYPKHFNKGRISWPADNFKKNQAIIDCEKTKDLVLENGYYVLTKRFSSKEEFRRIVAVVNCPEDTGKSKIAFENHINYFHEKGKPLEKDLAIGLSVFLNSTLVDMYFRLFSGHTQVNATDIYSMKFPDRKTLEKIGVSAGNRNLNYPQIDDIINKFILSKMENSNPILSKTKIAEAIDILKQLGIPKAQQNDRSGLTLLALLDLKPADSWEDAKNPKLGITEMMTFFEKNYGKKYAPNSRETVRRFTIHQFLQAGIVIDNPDGPVAVNSPNFVYQIENETLELIKSFGSANWNKNLSHFLSNRKTLIETYAQKRFAERIKISYEGIPDYMTLSPGKHNELIKQIVEVFKANFISNSRLIYLGDTEDKKARFDQTAFDELGIKIQDEHGKMPDVIFYSQEKNWLILVEAVTSHGPISPARKIQLEELFKDSTAGLVFITAFIDRKTMMKYLSQIAWETEVWIAEEPDHMMHLNGERFLGPYPTS